MRRQRGFTLVEVVVAFVLLSLVLVAGFEVFTTGMRRAGDLEDRSRALELAESTLARAGVEVPLNDSAHSGQSPDGRFQWTLGIRRIEVEGDANLPVVTSYVLYRVDAVVRWAGADGRDRSFSLATVQLGAAQ
jgi:general secretion pathway protein I